MTSNKKRGRKLIESISVSAPSTLRTKRGIMIGSTAAQVMKAYKRQLNKESSDAGSFAAGSIYGGLIFKFERSKVALILLGAAAE